jgi:hypothetical protein
MTAPGRKIAMLTTLVVVASVLFLCGCLRRSASAVFLNIRSRTSAASRASRLAAIVILFASVVSNEANAVPVTYTEVFGGFGVCLGQPGALFCGVGPSGKLGAVSFSNAILTLTFEGDTANVVPFSAASPAGRVATGDVNLLGTASVQVTDPTTGAVLAQGTFLPSAGIYVGVDNTNNGVSFGSFGVSPGSPSFPGHPLYPFGMFSDVLSTTGQCYAYGTAGTDPSIGSGLAYVPCLFTYDLRSNFTSGLMFADSCFNFPTSCDAPLPLATTAGDLFIDPFVPAGLELGIVGTFAAVTQPFVAFSAFTVKAEISGTPPTGFDINGSFTLGSGSNGINPLTEAVTLQIGGYSSTIPKGSFTQTHKGAWVYEGTIAGVALEVRIAPVSANSYSFQAEGSGANLAGTANPVTVVLTIGDDSGTTTASAKSE